MDAQVIVEKLLNLKSIDIRHEDDDDGKLLTKELYDLLKTEEGKLGISSSKNAFPNLHVKNMSAEQIWQQIEFHNSTVISMSTDELSMNKSNLCLKIAELTSIINEFENDEDDGVEMGEESDEEEKLEERTSDFDDEDVSSEHEDEEIADKDENQDEDEDEEIPDDLSEFSDLDKDTFGDIALEGDEDDDDDEDKDDKNNDDEDDGNETMEDELQDDDTTYNNEDETNAPKSSKVKTFQHSLVDSKFFSLRESEWIADNDLIGKNINDDEDDIDFTEDVDTDDEGKDAMYDAFFDPPADEAQLPQESREEIKTKSKFEKSVEQEICKTQELEQETYLAEKPWELKGEVQKSQRPKNSALEQHLEQNVIIHQRPIITGDTTNNIEQMIKFRRKSNCWNHSEKQIKPTLDAFQFKQKLILDDEKSKKSLAAIYEEEFLRKQEGQSGKRETVGSILAESDEQWEELPVHKEIKKEMDELFLKLDALSNCHYTPRYGPPEIKVVSNLPAIAIEEATPTTVSDATLLAPKEVVAPLRGELKGETEKGVTDKKRARRLKKKCQREKAQREEEKLSKQLKKKDRDGLINKEASVKFIQKAMKKGHIKVLDNNQKSITSSKNFFNQLQDNLAEKTNKKRKRSDFQDDGKKKNKKNKPLTMAQLLL